MVLSDVTCEPGIWVRVDRYDLTDSIHFPLYCPWPGVRKMYPKGDATDLVIQYDIVSNKLQASCRRVHPTSQTVEA